MEGVRPPRKLFPNIIITRPVKMTLYYPLWMSFVAFSFLPTSHIIVEVYLSKSFKETSIHKFRCILEAVGCQAERLKFVQRNTGTLTPKENLWTGESEKQRHELEGCSGQLISIGSGC